MSGECSAVVPRLHSICISGRGDSGRVHVFVVEEVEDRHAWHALLAIPACAECHRTISGAVPAKLVLRCTQLVNNTYELVPHLRIC